MLIPDSWNLPIGNGGDQLRLILFLDQRFANPFGQQGVEHKVKFIETAIYNNKLTWNNWDHWINKYREKIDNSIQETCAQLEQDGIDKELFLTIENKNLVIDRYFHIRLAANNNIDHSSLISQWENFIKTIKKSNDRKIINSDFLHNPVLSKSMYQEIIDFYRFDNNYESANKVHQLHYACHQRSLKEFCNWILSTEFDNFLKNLSNSISNAPVFSASSRYTNSAAYATINIGE